MNDIGKTVIPIPYFLVGLITAPIFLIVFLLPAHPNSEYYWKLNYILDNYLLGQVGFWSSNFPFSSKAVANYISVFGPALMLIFFVKIHRGMMIDPVIYKNHTIFKYIIAITGMVFIILLLIYVSYYSSVDLGVDSRKWGFFGAYEFTYALFSSAILFAYCALTIFFYAAFYYLPRLLISRWRNK